MTINKKLLNVLVGLLFIIPLLLMLWLTLIIGDTFSPEQWTCGIVLFCIGLFGLLVINEPDDLSGPVRHHNQGYQLIDTDNKRPLPSIKSLMELRPLPKSR